MNITNYIEKLGNINQLNEPSDSRYSMFNTGGVECEVGEFLYGLVRMIKPVKILETGTHFGISSTYMALALKKNNFGKITTLDPTYYDDSKLIHKNLNIGQYLEQIQIKAEEFITNDQYDIVLLDTEPILRFAEFVKFFNNVKNGGIIIIHDLHPHLSFESFNSDFPDFKHWPYGDFREKLGIYIKNNLIQTISFPTPRGITIFQKKSDQMSYIKYLNGEI